MSDAALLAKKKEYSNLFLDLYVFTLNMTCMRNRSTVAFQLVNKQITFYDTTFMAFSKLIAAFHFRPSPTVYANHWCNF